jgi:tRNA(Ile)-lysidine synthase
VTPTEPTQPFFTKQRLINTAKLLVLCTFPKAGTPVDLAVSGGADSVAMLVLATEAGCDVTVWYVDHGIRAESAAEGVAVGALAKQYRAKFETRTVTVADGPNLEARAREARYAQLPSGVMVGHTADDLAETVLANLIRGTGVDGLAPMLRNEAVARPILGIRRADTLALCRAAGLSVVNDPMNVDPRYRRVRIRHDLVPLLDSIAKRDVTPLLARMALATSEDVALLDHLAAEIDPTSARALSAAPVALARRALSRWMVASGVGDGHPMGLATVDRALAVARGIMPRADLVEGWRIARTAGVLRLEQFEQ